MHPDQIDDLDREGYAMLPIDVVTYRIEFRINPNGIPDMEDFWRVNVPHLVAFSSVTYFRFGQANGTWEDSLLDLLISDGVGEAFRRELFPDHELRLREMNPELAAVIYDLTADGEHDLWTAVLPPGSSSAVAADPYYGFFRFYGSNPEFPFGAATALGVRIVEAYRQNNPGVTASSLIHVSPEEIFEGSNYSP